MEEVRGATEGEVIVSGLFPEEFEEVDRLVRSDPGVGMSIFFQAYVKSAVLTYARCPGLVHRSCAAVLPFVLGGLCCLFASATLVRRDDSFQDIFFDLGYWVLFA